MYSLALAISPCCLACKANALSRTIAWSEFVEVGCGCGCGCAKELFYYK